MKKTLVLLLIVLSIFTLAGCQDEGEPDDPQDKTAPVITGTENFIYFVGDDVPNWLDGVSASDDIDETVTIVVDDSNVNLGASGVYDLIYTATDKAGNESNITVQVVVQIRNSNIFYVELKNLSGDILLYEAIPYDPENLKPTVELIDDVIELDYTVYDFGTMINGVGGFYPMEYGASYNYYYEIQIDNIPSATGIDHIVYNENTVIQFVETTYMSELDQDVDRLIYEFVDNHLNDYINSQAVDYNVLSALYHLIDKGYVQIDLDDYYTYDELQVTKDDIEDLSISELYKLGIYMSVEGMDLTEYFNHLKKRIASNAYELTTFLRGYHLYDEAKNLNLASILLDGTLLDPDYLGMALLALYRSDELEGFDQYIDDTLAYINSQTTATGVLSWGSANSSTTAMVVLGLVAHGFNPQDEDFLVDGVGLIDMLMLYETDGMFKWLLDDVEADPNFSTPQVFSALVAYKLSRDIYGFPATNIYIFND